MLTAKSTGDTLADEDALIGYRLGEHPLRLAESYANSIDFVDDHVNVDIALITSTHTVRLDPITSSPLR